jgi:hypothetical protein
MEGRMMKPLNQNQALILKQHLRLKSRKFKFRHRAGILENHLGKDGNGMEEESLEKAKVCG